MADPLQIREDAELLIAEHLDERWSFAFDRARKRAGCCDFRRLRITVSRHVAALATREQMRQTLLHEIAHALVGPAAGHGPVWLREARRIGYLGGRTLELPFDPAGAPWTGRCPNGHELPRFRAPDARPRSCPRCAPRFDERYLLVWRRNERAAQLGGGRRRTRTERQDRTEP